MTRLRKRQQGGVLAVRSRRERPELAVEAPQIWELAAERRPVGRMLAHGISGEPQRPEAGQLHKLLCIGQARELVALRGAFCTNSAYRGRLCGVGRGRMGVGSGRLTSSGAAAADACS